MSVAASGRSFLAEVAQSLFDRYGDGVGELKILFPSKRARLFFIDELAKIAQRPIWQPQWESIDSMMSAIAQVEVGDRIRLIAELFTIYTKHHPNESFDRFYFWGESMLADFDMVDKYLIDADQLFRNISDIKELESDVSYLSEEQRRIVEFWSSIGSGENLSRQKQYFLRIWRSLLPIYKEYRARLIQLGIAYPGLVHRVAIEKIRGGAMYNDSTDRYVIAGFNALSECEKILFSELQANADTEFFWDYDSYYADPSSGQEAGLFIRDNIKRFPSGDSCVTHNNFAADRHVEVVSCSSSALQCKYVAQIIKSIEQEQGRKVDKRTAIVLTDEGLLLPLLYSLPADVGAVNVTMGYPIRQTLAYSFVERLIELQYHSRGEGEGATLYHVDVRGVLTHPYIEAMVGRDELSKVIKTIDRERLIRISHKLVSDNDLLSSVLSVVDKKSGWRGVSDYLTRTLESVASLSCEDNGGSGINFIPYLVQQITTLHNSVSECGIDPSVSIYTSLLRRHLQMARVPFEGEPLEGLQVMGILESRNLDFDNVILLSMNDDNFPSNRISQPSYIPYNLRAAYGLPTPEHHDGVYAYYFYRLIQRAKRLYMLYCSRADEKSTGEQSRYITQLDFESSLTLQCTNVGVDVNLQDSDELVIPKSGRVAEELARYRIPEGLQCDPMTKRYGGYKQLSPTHLSAYIACPMRFYFKYIAGIVKEREREEQVDAPTFGNILHTAMQILYTPLIGATEVGRHIASISDESIARAIDRAICEVYLPSGSSEAEYSGNLTLVRSVVERYIRDGVLSYDSKNSEFVIESVEGVVLYDIECEQEGRISLRGLCDRIDRIERGVRIVDYKSGKPHLEFAGVEALFEGKARTEYANVFQILLYSYMVTRSNAYPSAIPSLYYVSAMGRDDFSPLLVDKSQKGEQSEVTPLTIEPLLEQFGEHLDTLLDEIFDLSRPFTQCAKGDKACDHCDYCTLCHS